MKVSAAPKILAEILGIIFFLLAPFILTSYMIHIMIVIYFWVILTLSLNLITGYAGQVSLCHAAFYGIGAYASAHLTLRLGISFWFALPLAIVIVGIIAALIGYPFLRLRGYPFTLGTLAFGMIVHSVFLLWKDLTFCPPGMAKPEAGWVIGIPPPDSIIIPGLFSIDFSSKFWYYYLVLVFVALTMFITYRLVNSRFGKALIAIRENEDMAMSVGIASPNYKLQAFIISSMFAGLAGSLYAHYLGFISADYFTFNESFFMLIAVIIGGPGSITGPIIGATLITIIPQILRSPSVAGSVIGAIISTMIFGIILCSVISLAPKGVASFIGNFIKKYLSQARRTYDTT